jgi:hypothetical protein
MADRKISELTQITGADVDDTNDEIAIVDTSASETKAITRGELFKDIDGNITLSGTVDGRDVAADGSKLDGIESNATADQTAGEIKTAYESNADTNAFTDSDKTKLDGIESGSTADQTAGEIKTSYESNADTNAFTDAEQSKLSNIEAGADVTDTANVTAAGALMDSELTSEASVKALDQGVATTDSPEFDGLTATTLTVDPVNDAGAGVFVEPPGSGTSSNWGLEIGAYSVSNQSDLVFNKNSVVGSQDSLNFVAETGGVFTWNVGGASHKTGRTGSSEAMRIDSSGNVGIGTSGPDSPLTVTNSASGTANAIEVENFSGESSYIKSKRSLTLSADYDNNSSPAQSTIYFETDGTERMRIDSSGNVGIGTSSPSATLDVNGSLSKNSGSFKIDHPVKPDTHHLVHGFVEGPQADNLYRGKVTLVNGSASVNLDEAGRMTQVRGKVSGNILTIEAQDPGCTDEISWLVIGERHDQHMIETNWTDENGRVITEPTKE